MKKVKFIIIVVCLLSTLLLVNSAIADVIVDTGPGPDHIGVIPLWRSQWLSAEFDLNQDYVITDIYGWMNRDNGGPTLSLAVYGDGGEVPDISNELYSTTFSISEIKVNDWYGATGLNWSLSAGTYWVAFEVRTGDFVGAMPSGGGLPINPLINEAVSTGASSMGGEYYEADIIDMGVRIMGTPTVVPEPISSILFITGGATLGFRRFMRVKLT